MCSVHVLLAQHVECALCSGTAARVGLSVSLEAACPRLEDMKSLVSSVLQSMEGHRNGRLPYGLKPGTSFGVLLQITMRKA